MMKTTMTLATNLHISPFELFQQDVDEVILLINFYIRIGKDKPKKTNIPTAKKPSKYDDNVRIHVNDKTATGGWY